jgi:hypothetical protein
MVAPEYLAKWGDWSAYGFVEYGGEARKGPWFTNHALSWTPTANLGLRVEVGGDDHGARYAKIGPRFTFTSADWGTIQIAPLLIGGTPKYDGELLIVWKSQDFLPTKGRMWTEGFIRTARGEGNTYGQPQVWFNPTCEKKQWYCTTDYGVEVEVGGADRTVRGGVRLHF